MPEADLRAVSELLIRLTLSRCSIPGGQLHTVLDEINGDPEVRALVITGAGGACPVSYSRAPWPKRRRSPAIPRSRCG